MSSLSPAPRVFGLAIVATSLLNMLIPAAARTHVGCVVTVRVMQGLVEVRARPQPIGCWEGRGGGVNGRAANRVPVGCHELGVAA